MMANGDRIKSVAIIGAGAAGTSSLFCSRRWSVLIVLP
jgi:predicted NAD/FAD-binding protein